MKIDLSWQGNIKAVKGAGIFAVAGLFVSITRILIREYPVFFFGLAYVSIAAFVGYLISNWLIKRGYLGEKLVKVIYLSNLLSWLIPVLGFFTGAMTLTIASKRAKEHGKKPYLLAFVVLILSLFNLFLGIYLSLKDQGSPQVQQTPEKHLPKAEQNSESTSEFIDEFFRQQPR